jgi:class 3 adenylate cyclase
LVERLKPKEVIRVLDHLHALMDEAYRSEDIFIAERNTDGCVAASGLAETLLEERHLREDSFSSLSLADSSYGSEMDFDKNLPKRQKKSREVVCERSTTNQQGSNSQLKTASYFCSKMATAALTLLSSSSKIHIPLLGRKQLQLRLALHSGPCSAGMLGLQSALGTNQAPQFKLFGNTVRHAERLCHTGLALQIRVSKRCKDLLSYTDEFQFERCPDYPGCTGHKSIESYWMVGKNTLPMTLPSLEMAVPLTDYEDTDI